MTEGGSVTRVDEVEALVFAVAMGRKLWAKL
jgi:hypothetical protein